MITQARLNMEKQILERYFPRRHAFMNLGTSDAYLDIGVRANSGNTYRFKIMLKNFPNSVPEMYVTYPNKLYDKSGTNLVDIGTSSEMHLLKPKDGNIQLCHYIDGNWHSNVTLYKVALKGLIWVTAYEGHKRAGKPIDHFLAHQKVR